MQPWMWALAFIAVLLVFGWLVDLRTKSRSRGLRALRADPAAVQARRVAAAERMDPGTALRAGWIGQQSSHGLPGGPPGAP